MKKLLTTIFLFSFAANAQKIKTDEIDKFTKQRLIETETAVIKPGSFESVGIHLSLYGKTCYLNLKAVEWATGVIGSDDDLIFLLDNDETVSVMPKDIQGTTFSGSYAYYDHSYIIDYPKIEKLSTHNLKSIRRNTSEGYVDLELKPKKQDALKKLCALFLQTVSK